MNASAATTVSPAVSDGETTNAAPATMSGNVKKNGLATPPVSATRMAAPLRATVPSTMNREDPSASAGRMSWKTMTNSPASPSRIEDRRSACRATGR